MADAMDNIVVSAATFEKYIKATPDHLFYGIIKREFARQKHTISEWRSIIEELKARPG